METYSLPLALLDFAPNFAFLFGAYFLIKLAAREQNRDCQGLMAAGTLLVFSGGLLKAIWKLLFTLKIADVRLLAEQQFFVSAIGFFLTLIAVIWLARGTRAPTGLPLLAMAPWKIPFLAVMVISSLGAQGILAYLAFRRRIPLGGILFAVAIVCMLGMSALASGEQTVAKQWIQETINTLGQSSFGLGAWLLYRKTQA